MWTDPTALGKPTKVQLGLDLLPGQIEAEALGVTERLVGNRLPGGVELHVLGNASLPNPGRPYQKSQFQAAWRADSAVKGSFPPGRQIFRSRSRLGHGLPAGSPARRVRNEIR